MKKSSLKFSDYSQDQIKKLQSDGWTWRISGLKKFPTTGMWFKHVTEYCRIHKHTMHVKILQETDLQKKYLSDSICRQCSLKIESDREIDRLKKEKIKFQEFNTIQNVSRFGWK